MGLLLLPSLTVFWLSSSSSSRSSSSCWLEQQHHHHQQVLLAPYDLEVHNFVPTGRGLRTTRDRLPGEVLIAVMDDDVITCDSIFERYPHIQQLAVTAAAAAASKTSSSKLTQEQVLALGLLEMRKNNKKNNNDSNNNSNEQQQKDDDNDDDNKYQSYCYAQTLPTNQFSVMTLPDNLQRCLPRCYRNSVDASKRTGARLYDQICQCYANNNDDTHDDAHDDAHDAPTHDLEAFLWAFSTVRSRSISADELPQNPLVASSSTAAATAAGTMMLLPGFDLLNHKNNVDVTLEYCYPYNNNNKNDKNRWQLTTQESYEKGDEVFLNYGQRDNLKMLFTYGFCCPTTSTDNNNNNIAMFDLQDLLDASAAARPAIFTKSIVSRIEPQLKKAVLGDDGDDNTNTNDGEQRAMFSLDDHMTPRESLRQGLQMMEQVAQQLVSANSIMDDDDDNQQQQSSLLVSLRADVIHCLTVQRREELAQGLQRIQQESSSIALLSHHHQEGWEGVRKSIEVLLQAETELLG